MRGQHVSCDMLRFSSGGWKKDGWETEVLARCRYRASIPDYSSLLHCKVASTNLPRAAPWTVVSPTRMGAAISGFGE